MPSGSTARSRRVRRLWIGVVLAFLAGSAMLSAARSGVLVGSAGVAVLIVLALMGLTGAVLVVRALRRSSDLASTPETGRLLDRLEADVGLLRIAEKTASPEDLRQALVDALDGPEARHLFGAHGAGHWSELVRWDELYDALPRRGSQVPR